MEIVQYTSEDLADVTNLTDINANLTSQVEEYTKNLSVWESYNAALHKTIHNFQVELKNIKVDIYHNSVHINGNTYKPRSDSTIHTPPGGALHTYGYTEWEPMMGKSATYGQRDTTPGHHS